MVNELPYCQRILQKNIIVAGLWFGPSDPVVNLFLKPMYTELTTLKSEGVQVRKYGENEDQTVKAIVLYGTGDSPMRSDYLNHMRFNGDFGCTVCVAKGYTISGEGFGNTHIFPFEGVEHIRTQKEVDECAKLAVETGKPVLGVKGPTLLSKIMPDASKGMCIDVMHCLFLGVVKKLMTLWFDSKTRFEAWSLYPNLNVVDNYLSNLKPPSIVPRNPRSIDQHLAYFKASEFKYWFFCYSVPILREVLKPDYFDHYLKLVMGIFLLCQESITEDMLDNSEKLLVAFVSQFQALYDARYMSFNTHLLIHLPRVVRNTGPLWVSTCFPMEDLLGKVMRYSRDHAYRVTSLFDCCP